MRHMTYKNLLFSFPPESVRKLALMKISVRMFDFQQWKPSLTEYLRIKNEVLYYKFSSDIDHDNNNSNKQIF